MNSANQTPGRRPMPVIPASYNVPTPPAFRPARPQSPRDMTPIVANGVPIDRAVIPPILPREQTVIRPPSPRDAIPIRPETPNLGVAAPRHTGSYSVRALPVSNTPS